MLTEFQLQNINKVSVLHHENLKHYEKFVDAYAEMTLAVVGTLINNDKDADDIFVKVIADLYELPNSMSGDETFCRTLLSHVYTYTLSKLTLWHIGYAKNDPRIMYTLIFRLSKLKVKFTDIAFMFGETDQALKLKLRQIVSMLRYSVAA